MKIILGFVIVSFLSILNAQAQFWLPTPEQALLVEGRTVLVEEADFVCNADIVEHVKKQWSFGGEVMGKTEEEINALLTPENASKYLVMTGDSKEEQKTYQGKHLLEEVVSIAIYPGEKAGQRNFLEVNREWIAKMGLPSCLVSEQEVKFFNDLIRNQIEMVKDEENRTNRKKSEIPQELTLSLKNKTLLLPSEKMEVTESEFSKYYKWPTKSVSSDEVKKAVSEGTPGLAYLTVLWNDKKFEWCLVAIDCETSQILATARFTEFNPAFLKKKFDANRDFLTIYRSKSKVSLVEMKYLGKTVTKAETPTR